MNQKAYWKKNMAVFLSTQAISLFGSSLVQYAITWHITLTTKSGIYAMLSIVCGFLPIFILSPFAGVWADRYNRKILIMVADGSIAVSTLILAILFMRGYDSIGLLLAVSAIRGFGSAVQTPAIGGMLPDLVPEKQLTKINGINGSVQSLITLASPMLSGVLMGVAPLQYIFFIDVITAAIAIMIMLLFLQLPAKEPTAETDTDSKAYINELKAGFIYIRRHRYLINFFIFLSVFFFMAAPVAFLTPLQIARNYGEDVWRLTIMEVVFSVGMVIGGLLIAGWGGFQNKVYTMTVSGIVMGICTVLLGMKVPFSIYLVLMAAVGLAMPIFNTPATVLLQEKVDSHYIGRVFGVMAMISSSVMPFGMIVFGPVADIIRIEWLLLGTGGVLIAASIILSVDKPLLAAGGRP